MFYLLTYKQVADLALQNPRVSCQIWRNKFRHLFFLSMRMKRNSQVFPESDSRQTSGNVLDDKFLKWYNYGTKTRRNFRLYDFGV